MKKNENGNIVIFKFEEPFAMCVPLGMSAEVTFVYEDARETRAHYGSYEEYSELQKAYPILKECCWNGMGPDDDANEVAVMVKPGPGLTKVPAGYKHLYIGCGSHLVIREDKYDAYVEACGELVNTDKRWNLDFDQWKRFVPYIIEDYVPATWDCGMETFDNLPARYEEYCDENGFGDIEKADPVAAKRYETLASIINRIKYCELDEETVKHPLMNLDLILEKYCEEEAVDEVTKVELIDFKKIIDELGADYGFLGDIITEFFWR